MGKSSLQLLVSLLCVTLLLGPVATADGDDRDGSDNEGEDASVLGMEAEGLGEVAQVLLIATLSIALWKPLFKWLRTNGPDLFNKEPRAFKQSLGVFNRRYMKAHTWIGLSMAVIGTVHGIVLEWHWTLWLAMACLWVLVVSGYLMQMKWPPKEFRKGARLLHMQRAMSVLAVVLLLVGHSIVD